MTEADEYFQGEQEDSGFNVNEGVDIGDFSDVKSDILPVSFKVTGVIRKASIATNNNKDTKRIKLEIGLDQGINVAGEQKYVGKVLFTGANQLVFWTTEEKAQSSDWYRSRKHLLDFKLFCTKGMGLDMNIVREGLKKDPDGFCEALVNRRVGFDIKHEKVQEKVNGSYVDSGDFREKITNWRKAVEVDVE